MSSEREPKPRVAVLGDGLPPGMGATIVELLAKDGFDVVTVEREPPPAMPAISIDVPDFVYKPNRKERRADAARARKWR